MLFVVHYRRLSILDNRHYTILVSAASFTDLQSQVFNSGCISLWHFVVSSNFLNSLPSGENYCCLQTLDIAQLLS